MLRIINRQILVATKKRKHEFKAEAQDFKFIKHCPNCSQKFGFNLAEYYKKYLIYR
jgi:hypothetical protein